MPSGLRVAMDTARTQDEIAGQALNQAHAERAALLGNASGDISRKMIADAATLIIKQRQNAKGVTERRVISREKTLDQAQVAEARSTDAVHVPFGDLAVEGLPAIVAGIPDNLGVLDGHPCQRDQGAPPSQLQRREPAQRGR